MNNPANESSAGRETDGSLSAKLWLFAAIAIYSGFVLVGIVVLSRHVVLNIGSGILFSVAGAGLGVSVLYAAFRLSGSARRFRRYALILTGLLLLCGLLGLWLYFGLNETVLGASATIAGGTAIWWMCRELAPCLGGPVAPVAKHAGLFAAFVPWFAIVFEVSPALVLSGGVVTIEIGLQKLADRQGESFRSFALKLRMMFVSTLLSSLLAADFLLNHYFDLFIYQKSIEHGYFPVGKDVSPEDYGPRSADIVALRKVMHAWRDSPQSVSVDAAWLKSETEGKYVVALLGDSFVWGQGLRNEERFAEILSERMNRACPTRVLSLANSGDTLVDNYVKYEAIRRVTARVDVAVFGLVSNDLLVNPGPPRYDTEQFRRVMNQCPRKRFLEDPAHVEGADILRSQRIRLTFDEASGYGNYCLLQRLAASFLPSERAIYFRFWSRREHPVLDRYPAILEAAGLDVLDGTAALTRTLGWKEWHVSANDGHPSAAANRVFADVLFSRIADDPKLGFCAN